MPGQFVQELRLPLQMQGKVAIIRVKQQRIKDLSIHQAYEVEQLLGMQCSRDWDCMAT